MWMEHYSPFGKHGDSLVRSLKLSCLCYSAAEEPVFFSCEYRGEPHRLEGEYNHRGQSDLYKSNANFAAGIVMTQ